MQPTKGQGSQECSQEENRIAMNVAKIRVGVAKDVTKRKNAMNVAKTKRMVGKDVANEKR